MRVVALPQLQADLAEVLLVKGAALDQRCSDRPPQQLLPMAARGNSNGRSAAAELRSFCSCGMRRGWVGHARG